MSTSQSEFRPVLFADVKRLGPGETTHHFEPGDFILTHQNKWTSKCIRFGQRLRIHGEDRKYTHWNHAAMVIDHEGNLVEALGRGVQRTHISKYKPTEYHIVCTNMTPEDRHQAVVFAQRAAGDDAGKGRKGYGFLIIASIAYTLLTGGKFTFALDGQFICSGLVARCMERGDAIFNRATTHIMPADLAKYYQVEPPIN